jgi:RNA-directed DNA polymerase
VCLGSCQKKELRPQGAGRPTPNAPGNEANIMKRYNNLYHQICDPANVLEAFRNASRGKSHYREVVAFKKDMESGVDRIVKLLKSKTFKNGEYIRFVSDEYGKARNIAKLPFYPDRIIQHAVCQVLMPIWDSQLIRDTYACVKGRGIHDGVRRIKKALKSDPSGTTYCLQIDINKYYPNIDNAIMKQIVRKKVKCADTLWLLDEIIDSDKGLPIGNYTSQHLANIYLSDFDHYCKEVLGARYYFRYCDDIVILGADKDTLRTYFTHIKEYLADKLNLTIKANWQIFPVSSRGIDFLGYRFFHTHTLLRKRIKLAMKKRVLQISRHASPANSKAVRCTLSSYKGWLIHANCNNLRRSLSL